MTGTYLCIEKTKSLHQFDDSQIIVHLQTNKNPIIYEYILCYENVDFKLKTLVRYYL